MKKQLLLCMLSMISIEVRALTQDHIDDCLSKWRKDGSKGLPKGQADKVKGMTPKNWQTKINDIPSPVWREWLRKCLAEDMTQDEKAEAGKIDLSEKEEKEKSTVTVVPEQAPQKKPAPREQVGRVEEKPVAGLIGEKPQQPQPEKTPQPRGPEGQKPVAGLLTGRVETEQPAAAQSNTQKTEQFTGTQGEQTPAGYLTGRVEEPAVSQPSTAQKTQENLTPAQFVAKYKNAAPQDVLGVKSDATAKEIDSAAKKLIAIYHPDKGPSDGSENNDREVATQLIQDARKTLKTANS